MADKILTLYERIGGHSAIAILANRFYDVMQKDTRANAVLTMHPKDLTRSRKRLENYLVEWFGGPELFGEKYVDPKWLKRGHKHLDIDRRARDQWMHCLLTAMRQLNYEKDLARELAGKFYRLAGYLRTRV